MLLCVLISYEGAFLFQTSSRNTCECILIVLVYPRWASFKQLVIQIRGRLGLDINQNIYKNHPTLGIKEKLFTHSTSHISTEEHLRIQVYSPLFI